MIIQWIWKGCERLSELMPRHETMIEQYEGRMGR
jgi:hypothetical protein